MLMQTQHAIRPCDAELRLISKQRDIVSADAVGLELQTGTSSPVRAFTRLQVEQQRRYDLVHVLRIPDVRLQLIVDRLPHHPLQPFNTSHAYSETRRRLEKPEVSHCY